MWWARRHDTGRQPDRHDTRSALNPDRHDAPSRASTIPAMGSDMIVVLVIVLGAVLIWRGPKTLPKLGQALGRGVREARTEASKKLDDAPDEDRPA